MTCIYTFIHAHTDAQMEAKASAHQEQCLSVAKRRGGERWRWDTGWVGSPRLSLCGSETSAGGSSWTQRTEGDLENELLTECPDYWCLHSYEFCGRCRLNHSVRSSYSDEYSALSPLAAKRESYWLILVTESRSFCPKSESRQSIGRSFTGYSYREQEAIGTHFYTAAAAFYWLHIQ